MLEKRFPVTGVPGHEFAGELEDGTPVGVEPLDPCWECEQCATGDYNMCTLGPGIVLGVGRDGGMADEAIIPESSLYAALSRDFRLVAPTFWQRHCGHSILNPI